jgi:hypothetical protein
MDIKRLPPSLLVALGLVGCGPTVNPDDDTAGEGSASEGTTGIEASTSACLDVLTTESDSTGVFTTGPCLGQELTTTGPCLAPELTTGSESGSEGGTSEGGSEGGSGEGGSTSADSEPTTGPCLSPPGDAPDDGGPSPQLQGASARAEILERMLSAGVLPPDIAAKLKA